MASMTQTAPQMRSPRARTVSASSGNIVVSILFALFVGGWRALMRHDWTPGTLVLLAGGSAALIGTFLFVSTLDARPGERSLSLMTLNYAGFLPYALGVYMTLYEGLWGFTRLWGAFSWVVLIGSLLFSFLGVQLVTSLQTLSNLPPPTDDS